MKILIKFTISILGCILIISSASAQKKFLTEYTNAESLDVNKDLKSGNVLQTLKARSKQNKVALFKFEKDFLKESVIQIEINKGEILNFVKDEIDFRRDEDFTWHGHLQDKQGGSAVLVFLNDELAGNIVVGSKKYALSPFGKGNCSVYEIDEAKFPEEHGPSYKEDAYSPTKIGSSPPAALDAPTCKVRIFVAFTSSAETGAIAKGFSNARLFIQQAVSEMNQSFINSAVTHRVELAATYRVTYTESGSYDTDIERFKGTADGYMDEIHTYRSLYSGDMCVLIFNNSAYCGLAYTINATASTAFCVVHYDCATGYYSFAHELGHLYGARHNTEVDPTTTPYAYGHGYCYGPGNWRTIMSYNSCGTNATRLNYWSNPYITYGGVAMGTVGTNYNAAVLNARASVVSGFVASPASLTLSSNASIINNEIGDAVATSSIVLSSGFQTTNNSDFRAYIASCSGGFDVGGSDTLAISRSQRNIIASPAAEQFGEHLLKVYPNPFNDKVTFQYVVQEKESAVSLSIFDLKGRLISNVINLPAQKQGTHEATFNGEGLVANLYMYHLKVGNKVKVGKLILKRQ